MRNRRATLIVVLVVALYFLNVLRIDDFIFPTSTSLFFLFPTSTSLFFLLFLAALGVGGAVPIVLGIEGLFRRWGASEIPSEESGPYAEARTIPDQRDGENGQKAKALNMTASPSPNGHLLSIDNPRLEDEGTNKTVPASDSMPEMTIYRETSPVNLSQPLNKQTTSIYGDVSRESTVTQGELVGSKNFVAAKTTPARMTTSGSEGNKLTNNSTQSMSNDRENASQEDDTLTSIYAKQKEYGRRVSELLKDLQFMANTIVQIPPDALRSTCMAAYLTSDAVVLMFDRDRSMATKPLRDFPTEVIVAVVAACTSKLKKSVLEKKQLEMGKVHSLEGAMKELEEAKAEVDRET